MGSVVALSARQRERNEPRAPPEETFSQIRRIGGEEAEAEARRRYEGAWQVVRSTSDLEATISEIAQRAFWDSLGAAVASGEYEALFTVLDEMQQGMVALVAHSARHTDELKDKFDAKWLQQQAEHGALEPADVHALMRYVAGTLVEW